MVAIRPRRNYSPAIKSKVALTIVRGEKALAELAQPSDVHPNKIMCWRAQLLESAVSALSAASEAALTLADVKALYAKISELTREADST